MRLLAGILIRSPRVGRWAAAAVLLCLVGCAAAPTDRPGGRPTGGPVADGLEFLAVYENVRDAPYFPIEGIAGVAFADDGTLVFCDEKGGRVHALDPLELTWYHFETPGSRFFRPLDVCVDQFSVLVLDGDGSDLLRYDLDGMLLGPLVDFDGLDPGYRRLPAACAVDIDGRMAFADPGEDQVVVLDEYLALERVVGGPGSHPEQFDEPSGVAFLPDGAFVVADRGNRRLQVFNRLGYLEREIGGEFDRENALLTPQGLAADDFGNLFVADPVAGAVHVYGPDLRRLFALGPELGLVASPEAPIAVALGPDDLLAVTDRNRQALLLYRIIYR